MRKRASKETSELFPVRESREKLGRASRQSGSGLATRKRASKGKFEAFLVHQNRETLWTAEMRNRCVIDGSGAPQ
jgi:hypothetical protein